MRNNSRYTSSALPASMSDGWTKCSADPLAMTTSNRTVHCPFVADVAVVEQTHIKATGKASLNLE